MEFFWVYLLNDTQRNGVMNVKQKKTHTHTQIIKGHQQSSSVFTEFHSIPFRFVPPCSAAMLRCFNDAAAAATEAAIMISFHKTKLKSNSK